MTHSYRTFRAVRSVYETRGSPVIADEAVGDAALGAAGLIAAGTHGDRTSEGACRARAALRGSAAREDAPGGGTSGRNVLFHHERTFTRVGAADAEAKAGRF